MGTDAKARWERILEDVRAHPDEPSRRRFLKLLGASMALAGVTGCVKDPTEKILPYTIRPPEVVPGRSQYYATSMTQDGYATGLLVESRDGRPIKIEGNPAHPASLGATDVFEQASILGLYDPSRARAILREGQGRSWTELSAEIGGPRDDGGERLRFLIEPTGSPFVASLLERIRAAHPRARFAVHSAGTQAGAFQAGGALAFGRPLLPQYDFRAASVIVALDADFLDTMPMSLRYARHFAERRRPSPATPAMNRLYVVEALPSPTGTLSDHRIRRRSSEIGAFLAALAAELVLGEPFGQDKRLPPGVLDALRPFRGREEQAVITAIARDLRRAGAAGLVVVGERQPAHVHALGSLVNAALGSLGNAVVMTEPVLWDPGPAGQSLAELAEDARAGRVDTLVMLEGNPVYSTPADLGLEEALRSIPRRVYLGSHEDETAAASTWFVPAVHYLETWGDARAWDGTTSIVQPLIQPLFGGRSVTELLSLFLGGPAQSPYAMLRSFWRDRHGQADFEAFWEATVQRGVVTNSASAPVTCALSEDGISRAARAITAAPELVSPVYEVGFYLDPKVYDGRFSNNPWLQELPDPITKLTWGNAAMMSPKTARELGVADGDLITLSLERSETGSPTIGPPGPPPPSVRAPALVVPGHAEKSISLRLGYGQRRGGTIAEGVGFDAYRLQRTTSLALAPRVIAGRAEGREELAQTQEHFRMHDRPIMQSTTLAEYRKNKNEKPAEKGHVLSILPPQHFEGNQWAMTIDTAICTGCSACVLACQAENNTMSVGKEGVLKSREMHWLRIDTYFVGDEEAPEMLHEPMLCQHCEKAPCEYVCPVNATEHSPDGLNEMIYNRCIGTRFCSNNCPYKVRRFNWFDWIEEEPEMNGGLRKLQKNPDVTVRERGVMEKCTFCVQRIRRAEIDARIENRAILPGEVVTACAEACPTRAIQFGSLAHEDTEMVRLREDPRLFAVLEDLGTVPRVKYLAAIKNPNPEMPR